MTKLPLISSDAVIRKLKKAGFEVAPYQCKGSHIALYKVNADGKSYWLSFLIKILCRVEHLFQFLNRLISQEKNFLS